MVAPEVVGDEEQGNATAGLVTDAFQLATSVRSGEQQGGSAAVRRRDNDPTSRWAERRVLKKLETGRVDVELERLVVVSYDQGHQRDAGNRLVPP